MLKHISKKKDKRLTHKVVNKFPLTRILRISHKSSKTLNPLWQWFHNRAAFSTRSCTIILITASLISATFCNWIINIMMDYDAAVVDALWHSFTGIFDVLPIYELDPNFLHLQVPWRHTRFLQSLRVNKVKAVKPSIDDGNSFKVVPLKECLLRSFRFPWSFGKLSHFEHQRDQDILAILNYKWP